MFNLSIPNSALLVPELTGATSPLPARVELGMVRRGSRGPMEAVAKTVA